MSYHSFIAGLSRMEQHVPLWFYLSVGGILLYGKYVTQGWQQLLSVLLILPLLTLFIGVSGLLLARIGVILSTLASLILIFSLLFRIHP